MTKHRMLPNAGIGLAVLMVALPAVAQQTGPLPATPPSATDAPNVKTPTPSEQSGPQQTATAPNSASSTAAVTATPAAGAKVEVPSGTHIPLVLHNAISTRSARPGDPVYFETLFPVMVDGRVAIPAGSYVSGEISESKRAGRVKGRAELMIRLTTMILPNAYMVNLNAVPGSGGGTGGGESIDKEGKISGDSDKASDAGTVMKTTAAGAGIGAIAARSGEGAGIGAGIGAAVGLAAVLLSRGPDAEMPRGTTLEAVIERPLYLDADKVQFTSPGQTSTLAGPPSREPVRNKVPF